MNVAKIRFMSEEHEELELKNFSIIRRKIRKWISNKDIQTNEIYNSYRGLSNVYYDEYILHYVQDKFLVEERKIIQALMKMSNHEIKIPYDKQFYLKCVMETNNA